MSHTEFRESGAVAAAGEAEPRRGGLRILVAHNVSRARTGGMSRTMGFVHDAMEARGHEVEYFCTEDVPARLSGRLGRFAFPYLVRRRAVQAARAGRPFDVVNVHEPSSAAIAMWRIGAGDPKVVVTSYGVERRGWARALEERSLGRGGPTLKTRLIYPITSLTQSKVGLTRADHIFCKNREDSEYLGEWLGIPDSRISRIYPGASEAYLRAVPDRDYSEVRRILFAASWITRKGIGDLMRALQTVMPRHPELRLVVLGGGVPETTVREAVPEGWRSRVEVVQAGSDDEAAAVMANCDIYVLPSLFEGTPLTLMEAMMSGLPVVTTSTCGMRDVIEDGRNGLLVPIRSAPALVDAIERLIADPPLRAKLGRAAREDLLTRFTWERAGQTVAQVYETLAARRSS